MSSKKESDRIADNESVYDEKINPLLSQILAICHEHGIPLFATFQLTAGDDEAPEGEQGPLWCSSLFQPPGCSDKIERLWDVMDPPSSALLLTTIVEKPK